MADGFMTLTVLQSRIIAEYLIAAVTLSKCYYLGALLSLNLLYLLGTFFVFTQVTIFTFDFWINSLTVST